MKVRNGFVSNSSSSSFVIHRFAFQSDEHFKTFITRLKEMSLRKEFYSFQIEPNFIFIPRIEEIPEVVEKLLEEYDIFKNKNVFEIED